MKKAIRIWEISQGEDLNEIKAAKLDFEKRIQDWLEKDISIISNELLVIGREIETDHGGFIDLLCLERNGDVVIIELKRDKTSREVTAQALDYASWVRGLSNERVTEIADHYLRKKDFSELEEVFTQKFNSDLPEILNTNHKVLIVASEIDSSTERIINYLSETYGVGINALTFQYFRDGNGKEFLARVFLIEPSLVEQNTQTKGSSKRRPNLSYEELQNIARDNDVGELYNYFCDKLLNVYFSHINGTRSSLAFKKGSKTILTLIPVESNSDLGLKLRVYTARFSECFGISIEQVVALLPENRYDWKNFPEAPPEWSGHEGYFKSLDEIEKFIIGLSR